MAMKRLLNPIKILTNRAEIVLRSGDIALVDIEDVPKIRDITWRFDRRNPRPNNTYVSSVVWDPEKKKVFGVRLHHMIMPKREGFVVDHINRNVLDNLRQNLRYVTHKQNCRNRILKNDGLTFNKQCKKWVAQITFNREVIYLGLFQKREDALAARKAAEVKYFGEVTRRSP